nr:MULTISPECIES: VPA1262 family N-terminal domain-containing protein [unclassified Rhizobium]
MSSRIRVSGIKDWSFGVARTYRPLHGIDDALQEFEQKGEWKLTGKELKVGDLEPHGPVFAPVNGSFEVPVNRLIKNNFWSGSHLFRLVDASKESLKAFIDDPRRLQDLSSKIGPSLPIELSGMSDFLGDIVFQLPVLALDANMFATREGSDVSVKVSWRDGTTPRPLRVAARTRWDNLLVDAAVSDEFTEEITLPVDRTHDPVETEIFEARTGLLLAASAETIALRTIALRLNPIRAEPRLFSCKGASGAAMPVRLDVMDSFQTIVGEAEKSAERRWYRRRRELDEAKRLEATREFIQYRPDPGSTASRERALNDIRHLITAHGVDGVDLWDPYLSADDILQTLFWSPYAGSDLRAITGRESPPNPCAPPKISTFEADQRAVLSRDGGNLEGLKLEYRCRNGPEGWAFHDRFLIFPKAESGPLAWSLGTSVNSLGNAHHILQKVGNAALISGAFNDLWAALNRPQHLIWRSW